jgi:hypothetical protein
MKVVEEETAWRGSERLLDDPKGCRYPATPAWSLKWRLFCCKGTTLDDIVEGLAMLIALLAMKIEASTKI